MAVIKLVFLFMSIGAQGRSHGYSNQALIKNTLVQLIFLFVKLALDRQFPGVFLYAKPLLAKRELKATLTWGNAEAAETGTNDVRLRTFHYLPNRREVISIAWLIIAHSRRRRYGVLLLHVFKFRVGPAAGIKNQRWECKQVYGSKKKQWRTIYIISKEDVSNRTALCRCLFGYKQMFRQQNVL